MKWITATDLETWSQAIPARTELPALIADLIRASAKDITSFRFPSGDKGQIPGFDGFLEAEGAGLFVPEGKSVWEFGVSEGIAKAEDDYKKRVEKVSAEQRANSTFVFVTLRTWANPHQRIEDWLDEKRARNDWQDVRYIDGVQLEHWLDEHPAVSAQYARTVLGTYPERGAISSDEFWNQYSNYFNPALTEEVLLCERHAKATELLNLLTRDVGLITICGDAIDEVIAFAIAAVRKSEPPLRQYLESRILILDTEQVARSLQHKRNLIFIPRQQASDFAGVLAIASPTVLSTGFDRPNQQNETLVRPSSNDLRKALCTMGYEDKDAYDLARRCGRSITVLRRIIGAGAPNPQWMSQGPSLIPALLAGAWNSQLSQDQQVIAELAGFASYFEYELVLRQFRRMQDSPLDLEGAIWKLRAPIDAFTYMAHLIGTDNLDKLKIAVSKVFLQASGAVETDELFGEGAQGKGCSSWLRDGLATTLLLIAALGDKVGLQVSGQSPQLFVQGIVAALPGLSTDQRMIVSLGQQLPLLAEAAPNPLLSALEQMLEGEGEAIRPIFDETTRFLSPGSPHTNLLWALEKLAWDPNYLPRASLILAKLARIDPGGRLVNRPINSLRAIFLSWNPCTNAPVALRLAVLDRIITEESEVGWELLVKLLPKHHDTSFPTARPRFREFGESDREPITRVLIWESQREIVVKVLTLAGDDTSRWITVIEEIENFESSLITRALELIDRFMAQAPAGDRGELWARLQDQLHRHETFSDTDWALSLNEREKIARLVERYRPESPVESEAWLFDDWSPDIPEKIDRQSGAIHLNEEIVSSARLEAIRKVLNYGGADALLALAEKVKLPQFVASAAVEIADGMDALENFIVEALRRSDKLALFAGAVSSFAAARYGDSWRVRFRKASIAQGWNAETVAALLSTWPDDRGTWDFIAQFGPEIEEQYWSRGGPWLVRGNEQDVRFVIDQYLKFNRPVAALNAIYNRARDVPTEVLFELLDRAVNEINARGLAPNNMFGYHVEEILKNLSARSDASKTDLARCEYAYLPLLDHRDRSLTLHQLMAEDPDFFVSVICDGYKGSASEPEEPSPGQRSKAISAFQLLRSFKLIPGFKEGVLDTSVLDNWVAEVLRIGAQQDRKIVAEQYVGQMFAHAPPNSGDHIWPPVFVRDLLEKLRNDQIERGLYIERLNMRGAHWKAMYEGGQQERELADRYYSWAKSCLLWPRTSALLNQLAEHWKREAEEADVRANQDKMRD